jgi:carbon-monoxide dehydrogenase small subunit
MIDLINVELLVNNETHQATIPADLNLMDFLRDYLGLTGTKNGCAKGHCGACTVLVDGKARRACLVKMAKIQGAEVETIEGLDQNGVLHPLQYTFIKYNAMQCGFCTPGMIMTAKALLEENPTPTDEEIKTSLTKNRTNSYGRRHQNQLNQKPQPLPLHRVYQYHHCHPGSRKNVKKW